MYILFSGFFNFKPILSLINIKISQRYSLWEASDTHALPQSGEGERENAFLGTPVSCTFN